MSICDLCQLSSPSGCTKLSGEVCLKEAFKLIKASVTNGDIIQNVCSMWINYHDTDVELIINNKDWNAPYKGDDTHG